MFFCRVERPRNRIILCLVRPIRLEYFVGFAAEYKLSILTIETCRRKIHCFVLKSEGPTTQREIFGWIFVRSSWCLHDTVQRCKCGRNEFSHRTLLRWNDIVRANGLGAQFCLTRQNSRTEHSDGRWRRRARRRLQLRVSPRSGEGLLRHTPQTDSRAA